MHRLKLFAKGNLDVCNSLHSFRVNGRILWNGINQIVGQRHPQVRVHVRHETWTRSDALLECDGTVPTEISSRSLPLAAYPATSQFSCALFETDADAVVLSLQPDVMTPLVRHRRDGFYFYPDNLGAWTEPDRTWLRQEFIATGPLDVGTSMRNFERIVARLRQRTDAPILVFNLSSVVPGESVHCHEGLGDILSTRIRRFNLGLAELSQRTGISVIDVDAIVARTGTDRLKLDVQHLSAEGWQMVGEEVVRVLEDLGCMATLGNLEGGR
ncbi:MAG: hypothetical protein P4L83_18345 [Nevskia sp.]|nr:hypothetical protein [Nevskia sp.]